MIEVINATFEKGVFRPDEPPRVADSARVRLLVQTMEDEPLRPQEAWAALERLWSTSKFSSGGDRLSREQLHDRD